MTKCGHSFCEYCTNDFERHNVQQCPICKEGLNLDELYLNYDLMNISSEKNVD